MALIILGVFIVFTLISFLFHQVNCHDFIANDEWGQIHPTSVHWIIMSRGQLLTNHKLRPKPNTFSKFKDAVQFICLPYWINPLTTL